VAHRSGLTIDTIRFYEKRGLLDQNHFERGENGYRAYNEAAVERLRMIKHAQAAGFTLTEISDLFALWERDQLSGERIVQHLREKQQHIAEKIAGLQQIERYILDKIQMYEANAADVKLGRRVA
jgi:DNA-binding transcriptional MerR regulator